MTTIDSLRPKIRAEAGQSIRSDVRTGLKRALRAALNQRLNGGPRGPRQCSGEAFSDAWAALLRKPGYPGWEAEQQRRGESRFRTARDRQYVKLLERALSEVLGTRAEEVMKTASLAAEVHGHDAVAFLVEREIRENGLEL